MGIETGLLILSAAGTALEVGGKVSAGRAAERAGETAAKTDLEEARMRADVQSREDQATLASYRASAGALGVEMSGGPIDAFRASQRQADLNRYRLLRAGQLQANADYSAGRATARSDYFSAAATGIQGVAQYGPTVARSVRGLRAGGGSSVVGVDDISNPSLG